MRGPAILAAVLLILFLLGQVRVGGQVEYSVRGLCVRVRIGSFRIQVFPLKKPKKDKTTKPEKPKKEKKPQKTKDTEGEQNGTGLTLGGALDYAQAFLPLVLDAAKSFYYKLQMDTLYLELTVGAADPADAAMRYGQASAVLGAFWYPLTQAFHVKDGTARTRVDFDAGEMTLYARGALSLKVGQILWLAIYFGWNALKTFLALRKKQKLNQKQRKAV